MVVSSYFHIYGWLAKINNCHAGLEPPTGARKRRKAATVEIGRNPQLLILPFQKVLRNKP